MNPTVQALLLVLLGGILGVLLSPTEDFLKTWIQSRGGELTGEWLQEIPAAYHKKFERVDHLSIRHRSLSGRITAVSHRTQPAQEAGRKWKVLGYLRGDEVFLLFWPTGKKYDGSSYGVAVMHRCPPGDEHDWRGAYIRPGTDVGRLVGSSNLERIPVTWKRIKG
jgi:hypothetical protein